MFKTGGSLPAREELKEAVKESREYILLEVSRPRYLFRAAPGTEIRWTIRLSPLFSCLPSSSLPSDQTEELCHIVNIVVSCNNNVS